jgi:hypothetical protein
MLQTFDHNIGFWEKRIFFAENWQKSQKFFNIASTPEVRNYRRPSADVWIGPSCRTHTHRCVAGLPDGLFSNQKFQIWENLGGPLNGKCWYIFWPFVIFYGHCVYFTAFWSSLWSFGIFLPIWNVWTKKNLATLLSIPAAWSGGIVLACGVEGREIESRQGIGW